MIKTMQLHAASTTDPVAQQLIRQIGMQGDASLKSGMLSDHDAKGYIYLKDEQLPYWSLWYIFCRWTNYGPLSSIAFFFLGPLDLLQVPFRLILWPCCVLIWKAERHLGHWLRRKHLCGICHHAMPDPFVYCKYCQRVQGLLRPSFGALFWRRCAGCGRSGWPTLGDYLCWAPKPLVCRDSAKSKGCYTPLDPQIPSGHAMRQYAILGPTLRAKHAFMGHLIRSLTLAGAAPRQFEPLGNLSELECRLCAEVLSSAKERDTSSCEVPGKRYTLMRSMRLQRNKRQVVLHNIAHPWLRSEDTLYRDSLRWRDVTGLMFVLDERLLAIDASHPQASHVEVLSRLIRVVEKDMSLLPGSPLPFKVVVVLPVAENSRLASQVDARGIMSVKNIKDAIQSLSPGLLALLRRSVEKRNLGFYGGVLPNHASQNSTAWLSDLRRWIH